MSDQYFIPQAIITNYKEVNKDENTYLLIEDGYGIYPLDEEIRVKKTKEDRPHAIGIIHKLEWENKRTILTFSLTKLIGVN
ncbi:DUF2584 family protein [Salsuginibacillus kocurii]|uniref:DUF2584 family protein n=1 Tax=Salsuginibacillus kocurii TaxID=427078 RepID=UPI00035F1E53|nr:DUF2584 family protein [Salsuginibacillus kocurii]